MRLTTSQKRYLRGLAHDLSPVVMVGQKGVTEAVVKELDIALAHHELVKVKVAEDRDTRDASIEALRSASKSELVQSVGHVACFFRRNPKAPRIELPR